MLQSSVLNLQSACEVEHCCSRHLPALHEELVVFSHQSVCHMPLLPAHARIPCGNWKSSVSRACVAHHCCLHVLELCGAAVSCQSSEHASHAAAGVQPDDAVPGTTVGAVHRMICEARSRLGYTVTLDLMEDGRPNLSTMGRYLVDWQDRLCCTSLLLL